MKKTEAPRRAAALIAAALLALGLTAGVLAEGPGDTVYIDTADDLALLAENCSLDTWSKGKTVILRADISLINTDFEMIPIFGGTFDGGGHTISDLSLTDSVYPTGLFGIVSEGASVMNLNVCGNVSPSGDAGTVGGVVGLNNGTVTGCTFTGTVSGESSTGGIAGINGVTGTLTGCSASGGVFGQHATGGIAGSSSGVISGCESSCYVNIVSVDPTFSLDDLNVDLTQSITQFAATDSLNTSTDTGGIAGYSSGIIEGCSNSGAVGYRHIGYNVGGIAGRSCGYVTGCRNTGAVCGRKDVGGIVGQMEPYIDLNMSEDLLDRLGQEIDTLSELINKTIDDADGSVQSAASRLNRMADYMDAAAQAVGNMRAYASIVSTATGSGTADGSASGEATVPSVTVEGSADSENGVSVSAGIGGEASADGSVGAQGSVSANSQITVNASQYQLSAALAGMTAQMRLLNGEMSGASSTLTDDVHAVSDQADKVADTAMELFNVSQYGETDALVTDASDVDADSVTFGKVFSCENSGSVCGDVDVGGIAGSMAIEYELDPEDDVSSELSSQSRSKYELKAVIQSCRSSGCVTSKKDCAGGVCGRVDLGLITGCEGYGSVESESGDYVGAIAGLSKSTIRGCYAKCTLSGRNYVGGILGSGSDGDGVSSGSVTSQCRSLVTVERCSQYSGAISGSDKGEFADNYFVSDTLAGLGQASYSGRAEPVSYEQLSQDQALPAQFRSFTLTFTADDAVIDSVAFDYGDSFDGSVFPAIPSKDGCYAAWDTDTLSDLRFDTVVTAVYTPYITALSSADCRGSGRPILYVEGTFCDGDSLDIAAQAQTPAEFDLLSGSLGASLENYFSCFADGELPQMYVCREIVEQWRVTLPDDGQATHTVRYLSPEENASRLRVYCLRDGQWVRVDSEAVGSYLTFDISGCDAQFAVLSVLPVWWVWAIAAVLLALVVLLAVRAIKKLKSRKKDRKTDEEAAPQAAERGDAAVLEAEERLRQAEEALRAVRAGSAATAVLDRPETNPKKKRKRRALIIIAVIAALLAAAAVFFLRSDLGAGVEALYLLKDYSGRDTLNMELSVIADVDGAQIETEASVGRVTQSGHRITRIGQDGVYLYHADDTIFLENGRAYGAEALFPDYSELVGRALDIYSVTDVTCERSGGGRTYTITASGSDAEELLAILLPACAERLSSAGSVTVELTEENGELTFMSFSGSGTLDGEAGAEVSVKAGLTLLSSDDAVNIPPEVLYAVLGSGGGSGELGDDAFRLISAWAGLEARDPLCADIHLAANCGPLLLDDDLEYFRVFSDGTAISCIRKNSLSVYFTEDSFCLADGSQASSAETSAAGCSRLLTIAYEACLNGDASCEANGESRAYTLTLDSDAMAAVSEAIAPDTADMDIAFSSGSMEVDVEAGEITAVRFSLEGSTQIVISQTGVSLAAELRFDGDTAGRSCTVPDSAAAALRQ